MNISIHAPRGGSDRRNLWILVYLIYFNPRSPWGERPVVLSSLMIGSIFQSTLPVGGATPETQRPDQGRGISIHAPRGGSDGCTPHQRPRHTISIHAPRGGSDRGHRRDGRGRRISIHAPRGGSDHLQRFRTSRTSDFNPRSPWGERLCWLAALMAAQGISIHAPRGGSDLPSADFGGQLPDFNPRSPWGERRVYIRVGPQIFLFQSTLPVGGATGL